MATADEKDWRAACPLKARVRWLSFTDAGKALVWLGLFPVEKMKAAAAEGHDGRLLAVALMQCAEADGGMIA